MEQPETFEVNSPISYQDLLNKRGHFILFSTTDEENTNKLPWVSRSKENLGVVPLQTTPDLINPHIRLNRLLIYDPKRFALTIVQADSQKDITKRAIELAQGDHIIIFSSDTKLVCLHQI